MRWDKFKPRLKFSPIARKRMSIIAVILVVVYLALEVLSGGR
jgi:hypothetical protein